ncbi:hypothetical protein IWW57_001584 [Coemansia sp. S610]|nr:hypothetical protein IWW57_001584 [Coemansia sp. S610]
MDPSETAASCALSTPPTTSDDFLDLVSLLCYPKAYPPLTTAQFIPDMTQPTNTPPTPTNLFGAESPNALRGAEHMGFCATGFGDSSYQRYQDCATANLGLGNSLEAMAMPTNDPISSDIALHYLVSSPPQPGVLPASTLFSGPDPTRMLRRSSQPEQPRRCSLSRSHPYMPTPDQRGGTIQRRNSSSLVLPTAPPKAFQEGKKASKQRTIVIPAINQDGTLKKCTNCMTAETPSWRRHPDTQALLCNACGLYLRLHHKPRPITIDDSGHVQVIRKNAAVQREPMNLPTSNMYAFSNPNPNSSATSMSSVGNMSLGSASSSDSYNFDQLHRNQPHSTSLLLDPFTFPGCQLALRTNTSLAGLQGISDPFTPLELYSPMPHSQRQSAHSPIEDTTTFVFRNMLHISETSEARNESAVKNKDIDHT